MRLTLRYTAKSTGTHSVRTYRDVEIVCEIEIRFELSAHLEGDSGLLSVSELLFLLDFMERSSTPSIEIEPLVYWWFNMVACSMAACEENKSGLNNIWIILRSQRLQRLEVRGCSYANDTHYRQNNIRGTSFLKSKIMWKKKILVIELSDCILTEHAFSGDIPLN